ncbi:hypothetical protein COCNU_14G004280 [Cocos nucifera]|uniref:Uncharacterized protein n=1 Tax=Cocos nucifera TaxID=13894 RepID=A0A8K0NCU0_COCNU|nr:hypothetical protein COCNU_14G004280 [Cocos nucifera]
MQTEHFSRSCHLLNQQNKSGDLGIAPLLAASMRIDHNDMVTEWQKESSTTYSQNVNNCNMLAGPASRFLVIN